MGDGLFRRHRYIEAGTRIRPVGGVAGTAPSTGHEWSLDVYPFHRYLTHDVTSWDSTRSDRTLSRQTTPDTTAVTTR
jgi:hypothetical protein